MTERMGLAAVGRQNRQRAALARRAELRPAARRLAAVAVGFAGGWAVVYGALMPFGLGGAWWAVNNWSWPEWVFLPAILLGLAAGAQNFWYFAKEHMDRTKKEKPKRVGFNSHQ